MSIYYYLVCPEVRASLFLGKSHLSLGDLANSQVFWGARGMDAASVRQSILLFIVKMRGRAVVLMDEHEYFSLQEKDEGEDMDNVPEALRWTEYRTVEDLLSNKEWPFM